MATLTFPFLLNVLDPFFQKIQPTRASYAAPSRFRIARARRVDRDVPRRRRCLLSPAKPAIADSAGSAAGPGNNKPGGQNAGCARYQPGAGGADARRRVAG